MANGLKAISEKMFRSEGITKLVHHKGIGFEIETLSGKDMFLTTEMVEQMFAEQLLYKIEKNE